MHFNEYSALYLKKKSPLSTNYFKICEIKFKIFSMQKKKHTLYSNDNIWKPQRMYLFSNNREPINKIINLNPMEMFVFFFHLLIMRDQFDQTIKKFWCKIRIKNFHRVHKSTAKYVQ